ncbi:hypothetical protein FOPPYZMZ_CDS0034 [Pseudomonas phage 9Ps-7B]|uniref:PHIKZ012 n=3 Tax=root TaxID=1 RepID=Q8SDF0_BPDPK|nr:hypothetical protein [Pseudomonas aeruginosa]NP_803578.1 PHIKZ012 [Pseudomonas phage phiKZ]ANM44771.1 hypothetical protein KTN4_013 [Pseudomonas phage KTN4]QYV99047.1 hypothetical protein [Pseudomonas phage T2P]QYV99178.1 hypothetical protein [Pseudomonas phage U1B]QYV99633.1 hypothetical protein [Pseudomonas phage U5]UXD83670.1 hypothetical protein NP274_00263 [Pseudomonas phage Koomba boorn-mokiny kep-wari Wadjak 2]WRQ05880.1 hypothetical protein IPCDMZAV_CDS0357 [Pseudomonas phage 6B]
MNFIKENALGLGLIALAVGATAVAAILAVKATVKEDGQAVAEQIESSISDILIDKISTYRNSEQHRKLVNHLRRDHELDVAEFISRTQLDIALNILPEVEVLLESHRDQLTVEEFDRLVANLQHFVQRIITK